VATIVEGFIGLECYADIRYLSNLVGEDLAVNSMQLSVNPPQFSAFYRRLKELPNAQGVSVRSDTKKNVEATFVGNMRLMLAMMVIFAGVIAFGSMLNSSLVEMGERARDIATFRVLGYRPNQVAGIFFRQNMIVFVVGLLLSLPAGYGLVMATAKAYDTELYRLPVVLRLDTIAIAALLAVVFVLLAQWFVYRAVRRLDWLESIKVKE
jgi:putative ABC transport system permease protein